MILNNVELGDFSGYRISGMHIHNKAKEGIPCLPT